jgi:hypothetical protein
MEWQRGGAGCFGGGKLRRTLRLFQGIFDRKIAVRLARHCRRQAERRNDLRLL